ncbi:MAG: hypothetical protein Q4F35_04200 [Akkermansia sp.]|nr:hypothetical protein [Akkermansia sp.]
MKKISTQINRKYTVTSPNGCRVCADNGLQLCVVAAGQQADFTAISHFVEVDDDEATISLLFYRLQSAAVVTDAGQPCIVGSLPDVLQSNCVYDLGELGAEVDFSVLQFGDNGSVQTAELWFSTGLVLPDISWPENAIWLDGVPVLMNNTAYRVVLRYEPSGMLIFNLAYEYTI